GNWIQMDTPIAPGNSGGPLVDMNGKIVGINTRGVSGQNLNFAIPINLARDVVEQILSTASEGKKGRVERSYLGVDLKPMQDLESFYETDINEGVLVNGVAPNSPAAKSGVRAQDVLLELNGKPVNVRFREEIAAARRMIADLPMDKEVTLRVKRGKDYLDLAATPAKLEGAVGEEKSVKAWGVSVRDVTRTYAND